MKKPDFSGWATRVNLLCSDGRTIMKDAFKDQDGQTVPLVWNHQHTGPEYVLGHALLKNMDDGVYCDGYFNSTEQGQNAKQLVEHGDVSALSIFANKLNQSKSGQVMHGVIREVSLVLAGANPGAYIQDVLAHGEYSDEYTGNVIVYTGEELELTHADDEDNEDNEANDEEKESERKSEGGETVADVFNTLSDKQKTAVFNIVTQIFDNEDAKDAKEVKHSDGGDNTMKYNVFDQKDGKPENTLSHADQERILTMAKKSNIGTFKTALQAYAEENGLQHDATSGGFAQTGDGNITYLFPEYQEVRPGAPELITNDQGWISVVMRKVHKSPISRIRTTQVDIRNIDALRAKGYVKGKEKQLSGNFSLVRRTTDPQTVYVKNALHKDDITDITDFDYVSYLYNIDRMMLNEELATAIMLGDGREEGDTDKIDATHIRPVWLDDDLYTIHVDLDIDSAKTELQGSNTSVTFGENYIYAEAIINKVLYARENFKGSGTPDFYCTPHLLNVMLLARDINGRRIYSSKAELASSLNVGDIYTAEQFDGKTRTTSDAKTKKLLGLIVNLADYSVGATKGGEISHFTQFDIDFNQEKSLIETRCSGALTRVYSAIALEEEVKNG